MLGLMRGLRILPNHKGLRFSSNNALATKSLAKLLVFPVTHDKYFYYFKWNEKALLNNNSVIVKYENKAVELATKGWNKLRDSDKSYNRKIVEWVTKFLEQTSWTEDSLRTIPWKQSLLRQVRRENSENTGTIILSSDQISETEKLVNIPVYYPSTMMGSQHLLDMNEKGELSIEKDTLLDQIYGDLKVGEDKILLNEGIIDKIVETYDIPNARSSLIKAALRQERKLLEKETEREAGNDSKKEAKETEKEK
ncbi:hypothetical protein BON22_0733 [Cyberlindnera fabianii]|uniref:Uncharacterized protein n=1 Tax=Cyberlindnera fabianii TaxID=36022 RepID=A0A1V2LD32_CYBFA|nr:hypothetical protein BON22_0733 [Cyberlindnera fabianii]